MFKRGFERVYVLLMFWFLCVVVVKQQHKRHLHGEGSRTVWTDIKRSILLRHVKIHLQVHLQVPCYDFYFLHTIKFAALPRPATEIEAVSVQLTGWRVDSSDGRCVQREGT